MLTSELVKRILIGIFDGLNHLLYSPKKVIWICLGLVALNLVWDGTFLRLMGLYRDQKDIAEKVVKLEKQKGELEARLKKARDPAFLEREARDRFDMVSEGDLVFVFSEEEAPN